MCLCELYAIAYAFSFSFSRDTEPVWHRPSCKSRQIETRRYRQISEGVCYRNWPLGLWKLRSPTIRPWQAGEPRKPAVYVQVQKPESLA